MQLLTLTLKIYNFTFSFLYFLQLLQINFIYFVAAPFGVDAERATLLRNKLRSKGATVA